MKKTTLSLLLILFTVVTYGQIAIIEDFENGIPGDWTSTFGDSPTQACTGSSARDNIYQFSNTGELVSPNLIGLSNATDLNISFDYKIVDWSAATDATAPGWGSFIVQYSTDGGGNWIDIETIDDNNHVTSNVCATLNYTVLAADLPTGSDFQLRFNATWTGGDYYLYFDNVSALQMADAPPACDSNLTNPADGSADNEINGNIAWSTATGIPTGYFLTVGTTSGGNDVLDNVDVGNVTSYALGQLQYETTYYATIAPYNDMGTTTDACTEQTFTTKMDPSQTVDCSGAPMNVTYCYGNNDDTFWLFTSSDGSPLRITFNAGGIESCCDDILIYDGVDNTGTLLYQGNNGGDLAGLQFDSVGTSLYMEIDADGSVSCQSGSGCCTTEWDFTVACATCVNPVATSSVREDCENGPQFFVDVELTDLGSATSITITDDQGSTPQTVNATGTYSFGPFANGTNVVTTVTNDDDGNCVINSSPLTQDQCVLNLVDCTQPPLQLNYCYGNNDDTSWLFRSTDGSPVRLTFNAGGIESCCDDILIYDGPDNTAPLLYQGNNGGDLAGLQFDSTGDEMFMEIDADGSVSCQSGSGCCTTEWDFTASCATCVNPVAASSVREDCENGPQFFVDVELTDLGSATSVTIADDQGSTPQTVSATGTYSFGPFANGTNVVTTVTNDDDGNCVVTSPVLTQDQCVLNLIDCTQPPVQFNYCYGNNDDTSWLFRSTDGSPVRITFNAGGIESCCDDILIYDGPDNTAPLLFQGNNGGDLAGLQFDSTGDEMFMEIDADGSVSCQSGSSCCTTEWDFTVACATCVNPVATYDVVSDCVNGPQFFLDVNLTDLGSATSITLSDDQGSTPQTVNATGTYTFGPFANTTDVVITVANDQDPNCTLTSNALTQPFCLDTVVDCNAGPISAFYCYGNNETNVFQYTSSDGSPLNLTIDSGIIEGAPFDFLVILDSDGVTELYNDEGNNGDIGGLTFQSTGDTIFFSVTSDGSVSCESGSPGEVDGINYTVACATCINPQATYVVVDDCANGNQFLIDVNIASLGDATSLTITDNQGSAPVQVTTTGTTQFGPYGFGIDVIITVSNDQDVNCVINSQAIQLLACPPENDNCPDAIVAGVNADSSCDIVTQGTLIEATDSGVPSGSCPGNPNDDVWFQFTALSEVQIIAINNLSGGFPNIDHAVYEGADCNNLTELYCSDDDASVTPQLTVGNTYFIRVFSGGADPVTNDFELCIREAPSNIVCENSVNFCSGEDGLTSANIIGIPDTGQIACLFTAPNPTWNIIQIGQGGLIEIQIDQTDDQGNGLDVDFVLWGPFASLEEGCGNLDTGCPDPSDCPNNTTNPNFYPSGNIVDCSYSAAPTENLTIDNAQVGEVYILLVTNFNGNPGNITITQTNGGGPGDGVITAEIEAEIDSNEVAFADLDNDPSTPDEAILCGFDQVTIFADSPFADTYIWYQDGFVMPGETGPTLTITESNTYQVQAFDEDCMDDAFSQIVSVKLYREPSAEDIPDVVVCDGPEADGVEDFDLNAQIASILGGQSGTDFTVRFYASETDRDNATNALNSPYSSSGETIYVRVDDVDAANDDFLGCRAITQFNLVVNTIPVANAPGDLTACDNDDGTGSFDLTLQDDSVNNSPDVTITYHTSEADANSGSGVLNSPYTSSGETIYVRVEDNTTGCYNTTSFDIIVDTIPLATFNTNEVDYQVCPPPSAAPIEISLIPSNFTESEVTVAWFRDGVPVSGSGLTLSTNEAGDYSALVTFNSGLQCDNEFFATITQLEFCEFPEGISPGEVDGLNDRFDL
ncbi:hypothetical protein, partial [Winogradskyella sp. 3972H.M.0a.05]|uniref:hypothetical protein n=1 Tax=Winogradskyella sp. 3972H.M.0a.05 TaxID=2950277 RepID=UPI003396BF1D